MNSPTLPKPVGTFKNLSGIAARSISRLGDAGFRRRIVDTHRSLVGMGSGKLTGYSSTCRDLLRILAAEGMVQPDECLLLMRLSSEVRAGAIVEIGSYRGRSTIALAMGSLRGARVPVYAVEPHEEFTGVLDARFGPEDKRAFIRNTERSLPSKLIHLVSASSETAAKSWKGEIGLLWVDGDHRYEAVRRDYELWSPFLRRDGRIAFDDSTVAGIGPHTLVNELLSEEGLRVVDTVGKITVLERDRANHGGQVI